MVTSQHEARHRIFQDRPGLLAPVFRLFGMRAPTGAAFEVVSPDATELRPLERRVDTVLRILPEGDDRGLLLAIEAQGRRDENKPSSWAYYLAYLRAKYDCPALLLVVCQDKATADWAAGPFHNGWGGWTASVVRPLALGPGNVPMITTAEEASADLAMATFSAMTHAKDPGSVGILEALAQALSTADETSNDYYSQMVEIGLGDTPARTAWRKLMLVNGTYFPGRGTLAEELYLKAKAEAEAEGRAEGKAEGLAEGKAEGLAEGKAEGLAEGKAEGLAEGKAEGLARGKAEGKAEGLAKGLREGLFRTMKNRRIFMPDEVHDRITACLDASVLERWLDRSFTVTSAEELFTEDDTAAPADAN